MDIVACQSNSKKMQDK